MTASRLPAGSLIITPEEFPLIRYMVAITQSSRRRDGLAPSQRLERLDALLTAPGQPDIELPPIEEAERITAAQAAQLLGVSPRTIRRRAEKLGGQRIGGQWVLDRVALEEHEGERP